MAVAVQPQRAQWRGFIEALLRERQRGIAGALPGGQLSRGDQLAFEQQVARGHAEAGWIESAAMREGLHRANLVHAANEAAEPAQRVSVIELRRAARTTLADREAVAVTLDAGFGQRLRTAGGGVERHRRHHGDLSRREFEREDMLFEDLRIAPASGPIELGDNDASVFEKHLEDAVLVGIELQQAAVAAQADGVERFEDRGRREVGVAVGWKEVHVHILPTRSTGPQCRVPAP